MKKLIFTFSVATAGAVFGLMINSYILSKTNNIVEAQKAIPSKFAAFVPGAESTNFVEAAELSVNAVVHITTKQVLRQNVMNGDPFHDLFFGQQGGAPQVQTATGSGVIITADGYIATNNHVVGGAEEVEVVLNNKKSYSAKIIGKDPSTDLALLKIEEAGLPFLAYGNSDNVKVGEWVLAVGNPFNLNSTVTAGIVSAKARDINIVGNGDPSQNIFPIESFIQTDAAVNPGNSGGALVSATGELVGINTAIASNTGAYSGYSFAVPVNIVKKVMQDLLEFGEVQRAFIGVSIREIDNKLANDKNLLNMKGIYISGVTEGGSAENAGIQEGDVITKIENNEVNSPSQLQEQVGKFRPGDKLNVSLIREGKEKILALILRNRGGNTKIAEKSTRESINKLGASFEELSKEDLRALKIEFGIRISSLMAGKLRSSGVKEGFIITSIDKKPVKTIADISEALDDKKGGVLIEGVYPNGLRAYYGFGM